MKVCQNLFMIFLKNIYKTLFLCSFCFFLFCSNNSLSPSTPESTDKKEYLKYKINILANKEDSLEFTIVSNTFTEFILPYHFFDNPVHKISGQVVKSLTITDDNGRQVSYQTKTEMIGPITNTVISLTGYYTQPVTINYTVDKNAFQLDSPDYRAFFLTDSTSFFLGNAVFIIPFTTSDLVSLWRTQHDISVNVVCKPGTSIYGIPTSGVFNCKNIYELLFCQISTGNKPVLQGYGGGVPFTFINLTYGNLIINDQTTISNGFSDILDAIWRTYGAFNENQLTVGISTFGGGLEGTYGFLQIRSSKRVVLLCPLS